MARQFSTRNTHASRLRPLAPAGTQSARRSYHNHAAKRAGYPTTACTPPAVAAPLVDPSIARAPRGIYTVRKRQSWPADARPFNWVAGARAHQDYLSIFPRIARRVVHTLMRPKAEISRASELPT